MVSEGGKDAATMTGDGQFFVMQLVLIFQTQSCVECVASPQCTISSGQC